MSGKRGMRPARAAVLAIIKDLSDRRGLRQAWESIDADIRRDITKEWVNLVEEAFATPTPPATEKT